MVKAPVQLATIRADFRTKTHCPILFLLAIYVEMCFYGSFPSYKDLFLINKKTNNSDEARFSAKFQLGLRPK
jgi:hypothetical protein